MSGEVLGMDGDMLIAAGYEQNDGWVRQFSRRMAA